MRKAAFVVLGGLVVLAMVGPVRGADGPASAPAAGAEATDWPQWRGPNRDSVAPASPRLLDAWPKEGPKLLWQSEPFAGELDGGPIGAGEQAGGCGSVAVAGGKVFLFLHCKYKKDKVVFPTEALIEMGWVEGMTEELAKKVEDAYHKRGRATGAALDEYINTFLGTLAPAEATKFADAVRATLKAPWDDRYSWPLLVRLGAMRDKEFPSLQAWNGVSKDILHPHGERAGDIRTVLDENGSRFTDTVLCMEAATGKQLWRTDRPGRASAGCFGFGASCTPTVQQGKCFVTGSAGVYCLDLKDGSVLWQVKTKFSNSSPLVLNGAVYVCLPDGLTAWRADSGELMWTAKDVKNNCSSPLKWTSGGTDYVLALGFRGNGTDLCCLAPADGKVLWRAYGNYGSTFGTPAMSGDLAVMFGKSEIRALRLAPQKGELAWASKDKYDERGGSAVAHDGYLYSVGGGYAGSGAHCHDLKTGELKWEQKLKHTEAPSPIVADGKVFAIAHEKPYQCLMFKAAPAGYEELGRLAPAGDTLNRCASPTVAGGKLYLRLKNRIACYDLTAAGGMTGS
jgi:outer membrane protein assembly factor BamB